QIVPIRPKARHNALSHSGAIAVIAPDRLVTAIVTAIGALQPSHRSARCTNSGHSARSVVIAVIIIVRLIYDVKVFLQITYLLSVTYSHVIVL
ncbi:hypothetical protein L249_5499, partial [Ophiocordyceps polyrhachis-furcata BCC 54312]